MRDRNKPASSSDNASNMAGVMERNIKELTKLRQKEEKAKTTEEHIADRISCFAGSMSFVYVHILLFGLWVMWNLGLFGIKPVDPSLSALSVFAAVEAIFLSTFVLISQNRLNELTNKRANLDLHVGLLAEHEVTRLITLVTAIASKMGVQEAKDEEIKELSQDVDLKEVLDTIDKHKEEIIKEEGIKF